MYLHGARKLKLRQVKVEMHNIQLKKELSNLTSVQVKRPKSQLWLNEGIPPKEIPKILFENLTDFYVNFLKTVAPKQVHAK